MASSKGSGGRGSGQPTRRIVQPRAEGSGWEVVKPGHQRASATAPTKAAAEARAKEIVRNLGGGEVTSKDRTGSRIVDSDTVPPGNDPRSSRDTKH